MSVERTYRSNQRLTGDIAMNRLASHISAHPRTLAVLAAMGALAAAALSGSSTIAAAAEPALEVPQTTLHYSLRDLSTDQGTRALYQRIVSAARSVCPGWNSLDLDEFAASTECQSAAVARAISEIGNARLATVHSQELARRG
jgi:UrcA family protein